MQKNNLSILCLKEVSGKTFLKEHLLRTDRFIACVAGVNGEGEGEGEGEQERGMKMGDWGLGTRERLLQRPTFFHFCSRQRPQNSDWLIFDSKSHGNDVI